MKNIDIKVTIEYHIEDFIDEKTLKEKFNNDIVKAYEFISDDYNDHVSCFTDNKKILLIERI